MWLVRVPLFQVSSALERRYACCGFRDAAFGPSKAVLGFAAARTPMAPACVKLWTRCLQDLQQILALDHDPAALFATAVKVTTTLAQWQALPPLSARDWRKLVLEVKVLGVTCKLHRLHISLQEYSLGSVQAQPQCCLMVQWVHDRVSLASCARLAAVHSYCS